MNRITIVERVYHQTDKSQPIPTESLFSRVLRTDEQPWVRTFNVKSEWQLLPECSFEDHSFLHLKNEGVTFPTVNETPEQRELRSHIVVELGLGDSVEPVSGHLHPGESLRMPHLPGKRYSIRCSNLRDRGSQETKVTVTFYPG